MFAFLRRILSPKRPVETLDVVARPTLTITSIQLRDGARLDLDEEDFVVVVGPNNVGKSALLKDIRRATEYGLRGKFISEMRVLKRGSPTDFKNFVDRYFEESVYKEDGITSLKTYGALFKRPANPEEDWRNEREALGGIFCNLISTEDRLSGSDAPHSFDPRGEPPKHPVHLMYLDTNLEHLISNHFHSAFGKDLVLYRMGGDKIPLYVGKRPELSEGETLSSVDYVREVHRTCIPLSEQGDGVRSYATILTHAFGSVAASILLLDEPEAFLHPPQARLLAETLSSGNLSARQFFVATHSADVLSGLLASQSKKIKIVKIDRKDEKISFHVLNNEKTFEIARDPLLKYSGVLGSVFHRRTFVCEGDSDCSFYNAILDTPAVRGNTVLDPLFIHAGGKHRIPNLMAALKTLDVYYDVICDIDVLRERELLRKIVLEAGGDWEEVEKIWKPFSSDINGTKKDISDDLIISSLQVILDDARAAGKLDERLRGRVRSAIAPLSMWDEIKAGGAQALPAGSASERFRTLQDMLAELRVWVVPVGTLEGFCKSVPGKTGWVQRVLEAKDLNTDDELQGAREFMSNIINRGPSSESFLSEAGGGPDLLPILEDTEEEEDDDDTLNRRKHLAPLSEWATEWRPFRPSTNVRTHKKVYR